MALPSPSFSSQDGIAGKIFLLLGLSFLSFFFGLVAVFLNGIYAAALFLVVAGSAVVLTDYRAGVWFLVVLMPFAATQLIPRQVLGVTGLNPVNVVLAVSLLSLFAARYFGRARLELVSPPKILIFYVALILLAAFMGSFHASNAIPQINAQGFIEPLTKTKYLLDNLLKPSVILIIAWLAANVVRNGGGRALIWAIAAAAVIFNAIILAYFIATGTSIQVLASSRTRGFLSWMGMHANEMGLLANTMFALLLYTALGMEKIEQRLTLLFCAAAAAVTAALTFSRGAFLGLLLIVGYYLISRRRLSQLAAGIVFILFVAIFLPEAFIERALTGIEKGDVRALTAGRYDDIWRPLWPMVWDKPFLGHGLSSTLWAAPNLRGEMLPVGHPHSAYLGVLLDFGLVGVVIVTAFFWSMWRLFRRLAVEHQDPFWQGVFEGGFVCLLLLLVQGLTDDRFVPTYPQSVLWLAYGLAVGHAALHAKDQKCMK